MDSNSLKPIKEEQFQLYKRLLEVPVELQSALLTRMMQDTEDHERDSALFLLGQVAELVEMKKHMQRFIIQGSDKHISVAAKVASTIVTIMKEVNRLLSSSKETSGGKQEPTFTPESDEFARVHDIIDVAVDSGIYRDDPEQESVSERISAIDELTRLPLDDLGRLDEIERAASMVHRTTARNDDEFSE